MILDLTRLINNYVEEIKINEKLFFGDKYIKNTEIRKLSEIIVEGCISCTTEKLYDLNFIVKGEMVLPCAITLEDVNYPFCININEILSEWDLDDEKYIKIINNSIDIMPIIWENIVMEIPLKVVSKKAAKIKMEGDGWRFISDEERNKAMAEE